MNLPQLEVYAIEETGRKSVCGYLQQDGTRVVLKPKKDYSDQQVIRYLYEIQMQGIPHLWGETLYREEPYLILSWIDGEQISEANLSDSEINQAIYDVLALIDKLKIITGMNWFFPDMKPQHIIIGSDGLISLIDFEHVIVSKTNNILTAGFNQLGVSPIYCSPEFRTGQLTQEHHEYALALIWLCLLSKKAVEDLTVQNRKRLLRKLDPQIKLRIESGLRGEGIRIKPKNLTDNPQIKLSKPDQTDPEMTSNCVSDCISDNYVFKRAIDFDQKTVPENIQQTLGFDPSAVQDNTRHILKHTINNQPSQQIRQNTIHNKSLKIVQQHLQNILSESSADVFGGYKELRFFEFHDSKQQEIVILTNIKTIVLCECHVLPVLVNLKVAYFNSDNVAPATSEILQEIGLFSNELQALNLLTKNLASHIVKKYAITDIYLSNEYLNLCGFATHRSFDVRQIQEYKSGEFAINSKLSNQVSEFKHRFWR
ncbi:MAG: GTP cyclohydrolase I [Saccharofermentanales bacterium]